MKVKGEIIKQVMISEELEISLIKRAKGIEAYDLLVEAQGWSKALPLADNLIKAALHFVKLVDKFTNKYHQLGLEKFKLELESVENIKLTPQQQQLFNDIISQGKSRIIN